MLEGRSTEWVSKWTRMPLLAGDGEGLTEVQRFFFVFENELLDQELFDQ